MFFARVSAVLHTERWLSFAAVLSRGLFGLICLFLVACDEPSSEEHVERARTFLEKGDIQASIIESKNAVQADRSNAAARLLLGQSYLKAVQLENAEKELIRARELGIDPKTAVEFLATVWLMQNKPELILGEFFPEDGQSQGERISIHLARAIAHYYLGDLEKAGEQFRLAREVDPNNLHALVGLSSVALEEGDLAEAERALASADLLDAENLNVLALTGDLNFRQGDLDSAEAAYRAMLRQRPDGIGARLALAQVEMVQDELDDAVNNIEQVLNRVPKHTGANFLRAAIALKNGNLQTAKIHSEHVLQINPEHRPSLLIAGAASLSLDQLEQAHRYLSAFLAQVPEHQVATGLLAQAQARLERLERYPVVLTKLLDSSADDQLLLTIRDPAIEWQSLLKVGGQLWVALEGGGGGAELDPCRSDAEAGPSDVLPEASQPLPWWGSLAEEDCATAAVERLGQALEEHRYAFVPNALLAELWLRNRQFAQMMRAVEGLLLDDPQRLSLLVLQGLAEEGRGENAKARDIFRRLTEAAPNSAEARFLLAMTYPVLSNGPGRRVQLEEALSRATFHGCFTGP